MPICLAMAGFAEAAAEQALMIAWAALLTIVIFNIIGIIRRSKIWLLPSILILFCMSLLFQPWQFFMPVRYDPPIDPDVIYWDAAFLNMAIGWAVIAIGTVATLAVAYFKNWRHHKTTKEQSA